LAGEGGIENLHIHTLLVHVLKPALRTEAGLTGALEALHRLVRSIEKCRRCHRILTLLAGKRLTLDQEGASPRPGRLAHLRRLRLVGVFHMAFPQPLRLHHVSVGIDNFESVAHSLFPSSVVIRLIMANWRLLVSITGTPFPLPFCHSLRGEL